MVSGKSPPNTALAGGKARIEAQGPFRLLRHHGQPAQPDGVSVAGDKAVALLVESARPRTWEYAVGADGTAVKLLVSASCPSGALCLCETLSVKNRMRESRSYGSVGESAGNRRLYPEASTSDLAAADVQRLIHPGCDRLHVLRFTSYESSRLLFSILFMVR